MAELVEDCPTLPSGALKEHILVLLESDKRSMKVLANMLNINTRELVSNYEECHGQVSLDKWKYVLRQLGYSKEHFQQLLSSDLMIPDATDIIDDTEENGCGAQSISRVWPECSLRPRDEGLLNENLVEGAAKRDDDLDFSLQAAAENGPLHENNRIPSTVQSLSQGSTSTLGLVHVVENGRHHHENSTLPEMAGKEENLAASGVQADYKQRSIDETTTPSRPTTPEAQRSTHDPVVTGQHRSRQNDAVAEPYPPGNGSQERSCHENPTLAEIAGREGNLAASSVQADHKQQSIDKTTTPSRPTTPEAPHSTHDPVVTGQHRSRQNDAVAEPYPPGNGSQGNGNSSKTCVENDYIENNNGLYTELQKANECLQLNVSYLVQELRKKDLVCARLRNECHGLQQQLQECRGQCTQLQIINEGFERHLEESAELENESQRLIRMIQEVCIWREQDNNRLEEHIRQLDQRHDSDSRCIEDLRRERQELSEVCIRREQENNRLEEHIRQLDQRPDNAIRCMEDLRREREEMSEELRSAFNQMRDLQERCQNLEREREQLRLCYEERMAEAARAFNNAETDKVKRLKQKLAREKNKRKSLLEKSRQLEAFVKELRSKEEGHFRSGGSGEDDAGENPESSSTASSEVENDEQFGSSNHNQHSESGSSNEADGRLEDASTDATESERQK